MLHMVAEQYDSPVEIMEYELFGQERIAQMEQEDLDRYHRSILKNSVTMQTELPNLCFMADELRSVANDDASKAQELFNDSMLQFRDETKSAMAELKSQLSVVLTILHDLNNQEEAMPISPTPRAENEIDDSVGLFSTTIHGSYIDSDSVQEESIEESTVEPSAHNMFAEMPRPFLIELKEDSACVVLSKMDDQHNACKVFAEMPEPILEETMVSIEVPMAAHYLLDERHVLSQVALNGDFNGKKDSLSPYPYIIEGSSSVNGSSWIIELLIDSSKVSTQNLNSEEDVLGVSIAYPPSFSKLGFHSQVFDPGTLAFFKEEEYVRLHFISLELLLVYSLVYGADNSINRNGISMLTRAASSNRPFSDFHVGALAQICPNGEQAAPRQSHGHDIVVGNSNVYVRTVNTLIQRVPLGDEYCFLDFSHFRWFKSDNHAIISLISDNIAHVDGFFKSLVAGAYSKSLSKLLCYCILSLDNLTTELDLVNCFGSWIGLVSPMRAEFTWDPLPLVDGIPQIFDPGTSIINEDLGAAVMLYMPWPSFCIYNVLIPSSVIETASSKSSTGKLCSISTVEKVGIFLLNARVQLTDSSKELILAKEGLNSCEYSAVCLPNDWGYEASVITSLELDVYFCVDAMLMIIFDPGGSPLYVKHGSFFMLNIDMQNFDLKLDEFNSARIDLSCTRLYSHHKNAPRQCQNVKGVVFSFDPGGKFSHNRAGLYEAFKLSFAKPFCFLCISHKSRKHELQVNDVLGKLISPEQAFTYNRSRDYDGIYLELEDKAVRVDERLNGAFTRYEAHSGLRFDFKEVPGAQRIFILEIDSWRRRTIFGYATYVCSFFMRGVIAVYLPSYVPTTLSFVLVIVQTDIIGVILGIYTMLSIEVSKAIDPEKDRDEFIVLMGHWEGTDEDIGSIFLELLSRMSPTNAVCNLTECKDDSPVTLRRAEFIMHILGVSFAFKILETILFISCLRYAVEYRKKALETTFGEFTVRKYLVFIYGPGRWYNSTLQRLDMADPILLVIKQSFGYETWVVCISKWTQSVLASLTDQDGIRELKSKQLNDQLLKCTYVSFQDLFSFTRAPIVISIVYIGEKHWVTKFLSNGNGSNKMNIGVCSNGYDGVTIVEFHVFIWDPGQNVNSLYILEDKDVVERVGKDMVLMDTTLATRGYDHEVQMSCLDTMRLGKFELGLLASDLKHFKQYYGYDDILDNILRPKRFKLLIFLDPDSDILDVSRGLPTGFGDWAAASLISSTLELEYFVWDAGSFTSVLQASWKEFGVNFHFTTLRTRWLLRGRICHDIGFLNKIYMYFRIVYLAGYDVT